ncbi:MAG: sulfur oxidation c-type cytochrome SoxX [Rhodocyclales bacterium]|nr:MAG: sulfur oxidation c-type cytochrome SoxX [Rhodocyclales bacterium]
MKRFVLFAAVLQGLTFAGTAAAQGAAAPQAAPGYAAYPCLSYSLPCGKLATRKPEKKDLVGPLNGNAAKGKQIAQARNRGNCLACHVMPGGSQPGSRGPDLSHFSSTGRSAAEAYAMVWDMRTVNPETLMPPFGTNEILTDQELRDVVAFLLSSK